ncbi:MAG: HEAT repeat domain-containing protein [Bryobacterales bacterium]|nr:HEAT repeat domain-containing protein [Bryobacterales bacterium]
MSGAKGRSRLGLAIAAAAMVAMPFLVWQQTWFGRGLSDAETGRYLLDEKHPRRIQHALSWIAGRIQAGDAQARKWYPRVAALSGHRMEAIRATAAWVMGQDNTSELFHERLLELLKDSEPMVRRNAALALVRFGDRSGKAELLGMLQPHTVHAPVTGRVSITARAESETGSGRLLGRVTPKSGEPADVRSPFAGQITRVHVLEGTWVEKGAPLIAVQAGSEQVWEALRGLYLIGETGDLPSIERYRHGGREIPEAVKRQAELTARAILARPERNSIR